MHLKSVLIAGFVCIASILYAETRTIEDFGGKADGKTDNGPALMKAFAFAKENPGTTLRLGGVCRVSTANADDGTGQIKKQNYHMAAGGSGIMNLTIENGEILLSGKFGAFFFDHCKGLTIRNVVFDYDPPIFSQGHILSSNRGERKMVVEPDSGYPLPDSESFPEKAHTWLMVLKPGGEPGFNYVGHINDAVKDENGRVTLTHDRADMAKVLEGAMDWSYVRMQRAYGHLNVFRFCDGLRLEGCSIHGASAFASLFQFCNDVVLTGNRICPREGSGRLTATCADGFHFIGARRGPHIENNFFDYVPDDNIVISLRGNRVRSANGAQLELMDASVTWYEVGDTIEVVEVGEGRRREYKIVAMQPQTNMYRPPVMTLDRPLEGSIVTMAGSDHGTHPTLVFNKSWRMEGTLIRGNVFQNTRRYAVFMGAGGVRIENNVMSNHTSAAILCSYIGSVNKQPNDLIYYITSDLLIRNNTIVNARNYGEGELVINWPCGAIDTNDVDRAKMGIGELRLTERISILDNLIVNSGASGIRVANARDVTLSGNTILNPNRKTPDNGNGINIEATSDVKLSNNVLLGSKIGEAVHQAP